MSALPRDRWVQRTAKEYAQALSNLLPQGLAWPRHSSSTLQKVIGGLSGIWGNTVEERAAALLTRESDPRETIDLLPDWERAWGLPDKCLSEPPSMFLRRVALMQKMTLLGAQSRLFFTELAAIYGYTIGTIREYRPFMVGIDCCGESVGDGGLSTWPYIFGPPENRFYWTVYINGRGLVWFRCGDGQCGIDPMLRISLANDIECILDRYAPAHTKIIYDYSGAGGNIYVVPKEASIRLALTSNINIASAVKYAFNLATLPVASTFVATVYLRMKPALVAQINATSSLTAVAVLPTRLATARFAGSSTIELNATMPVELKRQALLRGSSTIALNATKIP